MFEFLHWFAHEARAWVTRHRPDPSLLGLSHRLWHRLFGILCRRVLHRSGHDPADNPGRGDRRHPYQPVSGLAGRGAGLDPGRLDLVVDRLSLSPQHRPFPALPAVRRADRKSACICSTAGALGRSSSAASWDRCGPRCRWWRACPNWNSGPSWSPMRSPRSSGPMCCWRPEPLSCATYFHKRLI